MALQQRDVINRLKGGETLIHVIERVGGEHKPYQYLSGGGRVTARTYEKIKPRLEASSPGLFPDAEPQEWRWRDE